MTPEQRDLLLQAQESVAAARLLRGAGHFGFAASRCCYAMFYVVEALLLGKGLAFSKHSAVHAAFGEHFAKPGVVPVEYHRFLIRAHEVRQAGDYGRLSVVTADEAGEQMARAAEFLALAGRLLGSAQLEPEA